MIELPSSCHIHQICVPAYFTELLLSNPEFGHTCSLLNSHVDSVSKDNVIDTTLTKEVHMAAQLKQGGHPSGVQFVRRKDFLKVIEACENPPRASEALKAFVAKGRSLKNV